MAIGILAALQQRHAADVASGGESAGQPELTEDARFKGEAAPSS
jgi:hypothetical protein